MVTGDNSPIITRKEFYRSLGSVYLFIAIDCPDAC
jgi:hypothetical protein